MGITIITIDDSLLNVHGVRCDVRLVLLVRIPPVYLKIPACKKMTVIEQQNIHKYSISSIWTAGRT
jgi:hypothetical protein